MTHDTRLGPRLPTTGADEAGPRDADADARAEAPDVPEAPPAPLLELRDGLPPLTDTPPALAEACRGPGRGHRAGRDRRRARLRLPLLLAGLPDPAAPRGRRHVPGRPDRLRLPRPAAGGAGRHRVDPARRHPGPACLTEVGLAPSALFDTELAGRLLGYPRVGLATLVETLLGYRMKKEHSAADWSTRPLPDAVAGVRRPRRRGAGRAARRARRASWSRPARTSGRVRSSTRCASFTPVVRARAVASYLRAAQGARPPPARRRPRAVGDPRRARPAARRLARADHRRQRDRRGRHGDAGHRARTCCRPRASTAAAPSATPTAGSRRCATARELPEDELPAACPAYGRPADAACLGRARPRRRRAARRCPRRRWPSSPRSTRSRPRTSCPPTPCAGVMWDAGRPPTPTRVATQLRALRRPRVAGRADRADAGRRDHPPARAAGGPSAPTCRRPELSRSGSARRGTRRSARAAAR